VGIVISGPYGRHVCTAVARPAYIRGMADLDAALRSLMRDLGGALRPAGFRGSGGTWRLAAPEGVAIVSRQGSDWGPGGKRFYVNTAVVPAAWWAWLNRTRADAPPITSAREYHGIRLLEGRVEATGPASFESGDKTLWSVRPDTDLDRLRDDLVTGVTAAATWLVHLVQPGRYLAELAAVPDKKIGHWEPYVVLLAAERGPSPELDAACAGLRAAFAERPATSEHVERIIAWVTGR
jgi:hypothetical protein